MGSFHRVLCRTAVRVVLYRRRADSVGSGRTYGPVLAVARRWPVFPDILEQRTAFPEPLAMSKSIKEMEVFTS